MSLRSTLAATVEFRRFWQFAAVGAVGTACDFAVLVGLTELAGVWPVAAKLAAGEAAILVMFAINESWTFAEWGADAWRSVLRRLATSNLVRIGGVAVATAVLAVLTGWFGVWYVYANVAGIGVGFFVNYALENAITWRTHR